MENNMGNNMPPTPEPNPANFATPPIKKKWYQHKGIVWIIGLTVIAVAVSFLYFKKSSVNDNSLLGSVNQAGKVSLAQCKSKQYNPDKPNDVGDCYKQYGMQTKDINACKTIGVYPNDVACAIGVAVAIDDVKICDQVTGFTSYEAPQYGVQGCRTGYAIAHKNCDVFPFSQAGNTTYKPDRDYCLSGLASDTLDDSYCNNISSEYTKDACYQTVGQRKNDITICDKMVDFNLKDEFKADCYMKVAQATKNSSICDKITFMPGDIRTCYQLLNLTPPANAPVVTNPNAEAFKNQQPTGGLSVDFTLDNLEATGTIGSFVKINGKIINNSQQDLYLNGIALNLAY